MCGIFGYVGTERSVPLTVGTALKSLEYRGYDSWGIVWREADRLRTIKHIGKVPGTFPFDAVSRIAVGHTRWATHGGVTHANAHPHLDASGRVAIVHNGIVENAPELRRVLAGPPAFASETDSEVVAHLLGERVAAGASIVEAMCAVFPLLEGQNAVIAIDQDEEVIAAAMNVSPLVVGSGDGGSYIASDPYALVGKATEMIIAPSEVVIQLGPDGVVAFDFDGQLVPLPDPHPVPDLSPDELGPYSHFMAKEMEEQPDTLGRQLGDAASAYRLVSAIRQVDQVILAGCGSAYFAARIGAAWLNVLGRHRAVAVPASEFGEVLPFLDERSLVIAVTQSGETADILEAMRTAREYRCPLVALVNVEHSSAARLADEVVALLAGRERSVLATKSMTAMLGRLLAVALILRDGNTAAITAIKSAAAGIERLARTSSFDADIQRVASLVARAEHVYLIGKGDGFGVALEAALKIKEASYVHAEAFAAGELKHGAIALIEPGTPCIVFSTEARYRVDTGSSAQELRSRGGHTFGIGLELGQGASDQLILPDLGPANALLQIYVAQRIAFAVALARHVDPDYPRNLAKCVTVK